MKLKLTSFLATFVVAMGLLLGATAAHAQTVEMEGNTATAIFDLDLNGVTYDVEFLRSATAGVYGDPPIFDFSNATDARAAVQAVNDVLNAQGDVLDVGPSADQGIKYYRIGFDTFERQLGGKDLGFPVTLTKTSDGSAPDTNSPGVWITLVEPSDFPFVAGANYADFTIADTTGSGNLPPTADADGPYKGVVGRAVSFDGTGSSDPDGGDLTYAWDFGDDTPIVDVDGPTTSHTYTGPGIYNVTLTVTDDSGAPASDSTQADVGEFSLPSPPEADANGPYLGTAGAPVLFDGTGSSDPDSSVLIYTWTFGDGGASGEEMPSNTYDDPGIYPVILNVLDLDGRADADLTTASIGIGNLTPVADAGEPLAGVVGEPVSFDGTASRDLDGTIEIYEWDFGDDAPLGDGLTPSHTYTEPGIYNVTLTVTDNEDTRDSDLTLVVIEGDNQRPNCSFAVPSIDTIFPPTRRFVPVEIQRVIDPDGDPVSITIDSIFQDEPVFFRPDGRGVGTDTARVRALRWRTWFGGNGRVYHIGFTADDGLGGSCSGEVLVEVPLRRNGEAVDDGANFDSTVPFSFSQ